ncbi:MAG TPA: redoxin domain-containing protein [Steroidobacteraceae bacterium]|jgi:peroxiredoxin
MRVARRAVVLIGLLAAWAVAGVALAENPTVGEPAPDFRAVTVGGTRLSLADFKGQVLVIKFWPPGCTPCKTELPILDSYYQLQKKVGLRVIAVPPANTPRWHQLQRAASALAILVIREFRGGYMALTGHPTNYVIDRAGILRYADSGAWTLEDLNRILVPLLREGVPVPEEQIQGHPALAMRAAEQQLP